MAQTVAVVTNTLPISGVGATVDFTKSGFGTPSAAIIFLSNANTTNNPQTNNYIAVGLWDGTNQRAASCFALDNTTNTQFFVDSDDSYIVEIHSSGTRSATYTCAATTDGIRLTMSFDNTGAARYATVVLLAGISAKIVTLAANATQDATQESASLGFAPKSAFVLSITGGAADVDMQSGSYCFSFGFARDDGTHRSLSIYSLGASATEAANTLYSETRCVTRVINGSVGWGGEITTWGADTLTMTTRDAAATGVNYCFVLALGGADLSLDAGTLTTPTSTGNSVVSTDVAPDAILLALSTATGTSIETGAGANGLMIGAADDDGEFSHNISREDGAGPTNCNSAYHATQVIDLDTSSSGSAAAMCDATATLNSSDFTLNYSATDGTARKGWWVAFGAAAGGGASAVPLLMQMYHGG